MHEIEWKSLELEQQVHARQIVRKGEAQIKVYSYQNSFGGLSQISFYVGPTYP